MTNPYSATSVDLSEPIGADETYEPKIFAVNGRIGRLRYLAYSFVASIVITIVGAVVAAILGVALALGSSKGAASIIMMLVLGLIIYVPGIAIAIIMMKRRLNDLDLTGWLSLLMFVPLLNLVFALYLLFAPGTKTTNKYGPRPVKNSVWVILGGLIMPIFIIGVLAAVSIPAYQQYVNKAKAAQALQSSSEEQGKSSD